MGIFDRRKSVSRPELGKTLRSSPQIPGTGGKKYTQKEISQLEREVFQQKYGSQISKDDYRRALLELKSGRQKAKTRLERLAVEKKFQYLKKKGGI